jgi:hypothetical protein
MVNKWCRIHSRGGERRLTPVKEVISDYLAFSVCPLHFRVWCCNSSHFMLKLQALCCETVNLKKMHAYHPEGFLQSTSSQLRSLLYDVKKVRPLVHGLLLAIQAPPPHLTQQYESQLLPGYHPPLPWTLQTNLKMVPYFSQLVGEPPRSLINLRQSFFQQLFRVMDLCSPRNPFIFITHCSVMHNFQ